MKKHYHTATIRALSLDARSKTPTLLYSEISKSRAALKCEDEALKSAKISFEQELADLYEKYETPPSPTRPASPLMIQLYDKPPTPPQPSPVALNEERRELENNYHAFLQEAQKKFLDDNSELKVHYLIMYLRESILSNTTLADRCKSIDVFLKSNKNNELHPKLADLRTKMEKSYTFLVELAKQPDKNFDELMKGIDHYNALAHELNTEWSALLKTATSQTNTKEPASDRRQPQKGSLQKK